MRYYKGIDKSSGSGDTSVVAPESAGDPGWQESRPEVTSSTPVNSARGRLPTASHGSIRGEARAEETTITAVAGDAGSSPGPNIVSSSRLDGDDVVNYSNEKLGTIQDIMIDVPRGRVAYAVLSRRKFSDMDEKLFAIPWSALTLDTQRKCFVLDVDMEHFKLAEGFDKDNWPQMADLEWAARVHEYYDQPPYW